MHSFADLELDQRMLGVATIDPPSELTDERLLLVELDKHLINNV